MFQGKVALGTGGPKAVISYAERTANNVAWLDESGSDPLCFAT